MRRGELWRSPSSLRDRVILLVTSQTLIDLGVTMLYGVEADAEDPGPCCWSCRSSSTVSSGG